MWKASEAPWPLTADLNLADTGLSIRGTITTTATAAKHFSFNGRIKGDTSDTLARFADYELPRTGPYDMTFKAAFSEKGGEIDDLEGFIRDTAR